jgi:hypothetical protein
MRKPAKPTPDRNAKVGEGMPGYRKVDVADEGELKHPGSGANRDNVVPPKDSPTQRRP